MEDLQAQGARRIRGAGIEGDADRDPFRAGLHIAKIRNGFRGREGLLEGLVDHEAGLRAGKGSKALLPGRGDFADRFLQLRLGNARGPATPPADDDVDAGYPAFRKRRVVCGDVALVDPGEIVAHLFSNPGIVILAGDVDDHRDEAVEVVDPRKRPDPRPLAQFHDLLAEPCQRRHVDLEEVVAGVGFKRVGQYPAGMAVRIEGQLFLDPLRLGAKKRDIVHRMGVGRRGEEADHTQFSGHRAVGIEALDADVVHVGAAMDDRLHIRLGDDQEIRAVEEFQDFGGRGNRILALAKDEDVRVGQDAEPAPLTALDAGIRPLAGIDIFPHAEEGEVVVAEPIEEGECLVPVGLLPAGGIGSQLARRTLEEIQHRPPVGDREMDLIEDVADAGHECVGIRG